MPGWYNMKLREERIDMDMKIFPKDILNQAFLFDDNADVNKIRVANGREDNIRYVFKVLFDGHGRLLCLTRRALDDLLIATRHYQGTIVKVRFEGKVGAKKGTHWIFTIIDDKKQEFSITKAM